MRLRELTKGGLPAWSQMQWGGGGAFQGAAVLPTGTGIDGIVVDVSADPSRPGLGTPADVGRGGAPRFVAKGVEITVRLGGRSKSDIGILEWDGPANAPTPEQVGEKLQPFIRKRLVELGDAEIGERRN